MGLNPEEGPDHIAVYSFACQRVKYLGHIITAQGLKPNPDRIEAVKQYKVLHNVHTVCQFCLTLFYRRFIPGFA